MVKNIKVHNTAYALCRSKDYTVNDTMNESVNYDFTTGINMLKGEIDDGIWAVSYLLSMYTYRPDDFECLYERSGRLIIVNCVHLSNKAIRIFLNVFFVVFVGTSREVFIVSSLFVNNRFFL